MKTTFEQGKSGLRNSWLVSAKEYEKINGCSIVYVYVKGESVIEQLYARKHRPHQALRPIVKAELEKHGIKGTLRWSQRAGCSCPCSPGFLIINGDIGNDYWITIEED